MNIASPGAHSRLRLALSGHTHAADPACLLKDQHQHLMDKSAEQDGAYWGAWVLSHFATLALSGLLCAAIARYPFPHTAFSVMLSLLWLTAAALLAFAYFLSTLFQASRVAGMASAMLYALAMVPGCARCRPRPAVLARSCGHMTWARGLCAVLDCRRPWLAHAARRWCLYCVLCPPAAHRVF